MVLNNEEKKMCKWRLCDDLTEIILSYISFLDKVKLECVSKQFQKTIFRKQYDIEIYEFDPKKLYLFEKIVNIENIGLILKKCSNIKKINIKGYINDKIFNDLIHLIIKYNNSMNTFMIHENDMNLLSNETLNNFIKKFESKLKSFYYYSNHSKLKPPYHYSDNLPLNYFNYSYMKSFRYLKSITGRIFLKQLFDYKGELIFNNLYEVEIIYKKKDSELLDKFISNNIAINKFIINLESHLNEEDIDHVFNCIFKLKDLIIFEFYYTDNNLILFSDPLKRMAINCPKLKSFSIINWCSDINSLNLIINSLKEFKQLRYLEINFEYLQTIKLIKELPYLTHLELYSYEILNPHFLDSINSIVPNLNYLIIDTDCGLEISYESINSLVKLVNLKTIKINIKNKEIINELESKLIKNCPNLKIINI